MNRYLLSVIVVIGMTYGCKKDGKLIPASPDTTSEITALSDDGENISKSYTPEKLNEFSQYSFGGVAGTYFGYRSSFKIGDKSKIDISFGTILTTDLSLSEEEMVSLISPGEKMFGSLGAYTSYPQLLPNRVEIAYTDDHQQRWCSTIITERQRSWGMETSVKISQPDSRFEVDKIKPVEISSTSDGYRVEGHFKCTLYEVNGKRSKKINGNFSGIISRAN